MKRGFTLTELLIVIMIIAILAGLALSAMSAAAELAREQRTRAIIAKLDQLIMEKYEGYRTRAVPLSLATRRPNDPNDRTPQRTASLARLNGLRELMRLEMPDRISDLGDIANANHLVQTNVIKSIPSVTRAYKRQAKPGWSTQHQGSECLYLILTQIHDGDKRATDYFLPEEIGDVDGDGMKEILDGWGQPIEFLRWAPGYVTNTGMLTTQTQPNGSNVYTPDPFDPARVDSRYRDADITNDPFELRPLLISGGRDKELGIVLDNSPVPLSYFQNGNDPWLALTPQRIGEPLAGATTYADNITSHYQAE